MVMWTFENWISFIRYFPVRVWKCQPVEPYALIPGGWARTMPFIYAGPLPARRWNVRHNDTSVLLSCRSAGKSTRKHWYNWKKCLKMAEEAKRATRDSKSEKKRTTDEKKANECINKGHANYFAHPRCRRARFFLSLFHKQWFFLVLIPW